MLMFSIIINFVDDRLYKSEIKNNEFLMMAFCDREWPKLYSFCNSIIDPMNLPYSTNWK